MSTPMIPTGDFHGWTAAHNPEFHQHMTAVFGVGWNERMTGDEVRGFAKRWNFVKLYSNSPVRVHLDGKLVAAAIAMPASADLVGHRTPVEPTPPPPPPEPPTGPKKADVWPAIFADVRTWNTSGLRAVLVQHEQMATITLPIETLLALARGFSDAMIQLGPGADDTVAETAAEAFMVRPHAVEQATAIARHLINAHG